MKSMLFLEFRNCLNRNEFKFIFILLMLISIGGFAFACIRYYGLDIIYTRSAFEMCLLREITARNLYGVECALMPLLASIIYSDSYYSDFQTGVYNNILTRTDARIYIWTKAIVIIIVVFFAFFIPLVLNQLFCMIAFPLQGFDNNFALPPYDIGVQNYNSSSMFDLLRLQSPLLYNFLYMCLFSLFGALFALFTYGAFFIFKKNKFTTISGVFLLYIAVEVVVNALGNFRMSLVELLQPGNNGQFRILLLWMSALFLLSLAMIIIKSIKHRTDV